MKQPLDLKLTLSKKDSILKVVAMVNFKYLTLTIILMVLAAVAGFYVGNSKGTKVSLLPNQINLPGTTESSPLFGSQSATINGKITQLNGQTATVTDFKNQTAQFPVSLKVIIFKIGTNPALSSPSADLKSIELNRPAIINLGYTNNQFEITSVRFLPK